MIDQIDIHKNKVQDFVLTGLKLTGDENGNCLVIQISNKEGNFIGSIQNLEVFHFAVSVIPNPYHTEFAGTVWSEIKSQNIAQFNKKRELYGGQSLDSILEFWVTSYFFEGTFLIDEPYLSEDDIIYYRDSELQKTFQSPLQSFAPPNGYDIDPQIHPPFPDYSMVFPSIPTFEYHGTEREMIISFYYERVGSSPGPQQFIRLKDVRYFKLTDYSIFDLGPGFEGIQFHYHLNQVIGSNWIKHLKAEHQKKGKVFPKGLAHYILPVSNRNPGAETMHNWIEIIAGEAELINHNLWG